MHRLPLIVIKRSSRPGKDVAIFHSGYFLATLDWVKRTLEKPSHIFFMQLEMHFQQDRFICNKNVHFGSKDPVHVICFVQNLLRPLQTFKIHSFSCSQSPICQDSKDRHQQNSKAIYHMYSSSFESSFLKKST